ncbi:MAG TPA: carboxy terminal-processing peptidase [Verrucomicrobiae bacterium]
MLHIIMRPNRIIVLALVVAAGLAVWAGCKTTKSQASASAPLTAAQLADGVQPEPDDPRIAHLVARMLAAYHYLQRPLDKDLSAKLFDGYINSLDPRHANFLQSDLEQFAWVRTNLDVLTLGGSGGADLKPAFAIYHIFCERSVQHADYVNELLQQDKFKFTADDKIVIDRRKAPFPKDLDEAQQLWRQQVRYEYLTAKLALEISETNGQFVVKLPDGAGTNIVADMERHNRWILRMTTNWDSDTVLTTYLNAMTHAYDPHTDYFSAPKAQDFAIDMNLALFGIGAQLTEDYGYCTIHELVPGGPAAKSKAFNPGDRIVAVAQDNQPPVNVVDMDLEKVVQLIRGPKGTKVTLTLSPVDDRAARPVVHLVRDEIKLEDRQAKADLIEYPDGKRIGVIDLPSFYAPVGDITPGAATTPRFTTVDVAKLIIKLKQEKVDGMILDLRGNPGGSLEEAVKLTGLFIKDGPVVLCRDGETRRTIQYSDPDPNVLYDGPLVVMINRFSASASEIAAAALQDYGRAVIVGDTSTHGKGTVQQLIPIRLADPEMTNDPGTLKITKGKFYRITGASTQWKGVASDIVLPDIWNYSTQVGETNLPNALPWDTIPPVSFDNLNLVQPYLAELRSRDAARLATNQDYAYIGQDIAQFIKTQADKTATLNEREAIEQREQATELNNAYKKEVNRRPPPDEKIYELTVQDAAQSGLPAPEMFFATNYDVTTSLGKDSVTLEAIAAVIEKLDTNHTNHFAVDSSIKSKPSYYAVDVYTNYFIDYLASFTNFFRTNFPDMADAKFIFTNSTSTNIIAEISNPLSMTNQVVKPNVTKSHEQHSPGNPFTSVETVTPAVTKTYQPDAALNETEDILQDYISLLAKSGMLTANQINP